MLVAKILLVGLVSITQTCISFSLAHQSTWNEEYRNLQREECPILSATLDKCSTNFLFIRNIDGTLWNGGSDIMSFSGCYDKDQCYSVEAGSIMYECRFEVVMDGVTVMKQTISKDESYAGKLFFIGKCSTQCPGETALALTYSTIIVKKDLKYSLYQFDRGQIDGVLLHGESRIFCIDLKRCNLLEVNALGNYYLLQENKIIEKELSELANFGTKQASYGKFNKSHLFGNCMKNCTDIKVIMTNTDPADKYFYTIDEDGHLLEEGNLDVGDKEFCLNTRKCNEVDGGKATYMIIDDGDFISKGPSISALSLGSCKRKVCDSKPILSSTKRGRDMFSFISSTSTMEDMINVGTWHYEAICWLIYDDTKQLQASDPFLTQRYVLALFYLSTIGWDWHSNLGFMSAKDECSWGGIFCVDGYVTELNMYENNLAGTLISELYVLPHLERLDLMKNFQLGGSLPDGMERLHHLKFFRLFYSDITGTLPKKIFLIDSLEVLIIHNTLMTGSLPNKYNDLSRLNRLSVGGNIFTGTIPKWISHCSNLEHLRGGFNYFLGKIPDLATLTKLKIVSLADNKLSGTIPSEMFRLPALEQFKLDSNRLLGSIPNDIQSISLKIIWLFHNEITGTLPPELSKLTHLHSLRIERNMIVGEFPFELKELTSLSELQLQDNLITGTIPFDECGQFNFLISDCFIPRNIVCKCCTDCSGIFNSFRDILPCLTTINIIFDFHPKDVHAYTLETVSKSFIGRVEDAFIVNRPDDAIYSQCISPTSCYTFTISSSSHSRILVENDIIFQDLPLVGSFSFGYSTDGIMKPNKCDDFLVCNRILKSGTLQRNLLNLITRFSTISNDQNKQSSHQYSALCWWLDDLDRKSYDSLQNTALIQRYILALLYFSTEGLQWHDQSKWLSNDSECRWFGVSCEIPGVVTTLNLSSNNMRGYIPSELGELQGLENLIMNSNELNGKIPVEIVKLLNMRILILATNTFTGTIFPEIKFLDRLRYLDLEGNKLTSSIPTQIGILDTMEYISLADNALSGPIPVELKNLVKLKSILFGSNLLRGNTHMINGIVDLELLDLSYNYFTGSLPLYGENQLRLKYVLLNNNKFNGVVPSHIDKSISIEELILSNNELTGLLPSSIGKLRNISKLAISYNSLKGHITSDLSNLNNLKLLHVHGNKFKGELNLFNYTINSFVSDCGSSETASGPIECSECTQCCNIEGNCITEGNKWLSRNNIITLEVSSEVFIILTVVAVSVFFYLFCLVLMELKVKLPPLPFKVRINFQEGSVFRFYLSSYTSAWLIATLVMVFQCVICAMIVKTGDSTFDGNLLIHSVLCPDDSLECIDSSLVNNYGWILCGIILVSFLLPDFLDGALLVYESITMRSKKLIIGGIAVMSTLVLFMFASFIFLQASSISNISIVKETVIILFLNKMDEQWYWIMEIIAPSWLDRVENEIINNCEIEATTPITCTHVLAVKKEILVASIEKVRRKIECFEQLPGKLQHDLNNINSAYAAKPDFPSTSHSNNSDADKVKWDRLMHRFYQVKANLLCKSDKTKDLHKDIVTLRGQQKITDFFQPRN